MCLVQVVRVSDLLKFMREQLFWQSKMEHLDVKFINLRQVKPQHNLSNTALYAHHLS